MATDTSMTGVNGNYGMPPPYNVTEVSAHNPATAAAADGANGAGSTASSEYAQTDTHSNDEVGWYFVEQYYTTLSKTPDKLHLFYAKKSQFVSGIEAEKVSVSVGQKAINERIKELAIEDCKVRVTNVDSQGSLDKSIVIQVIGEMSMKGAPHKKFVQTFVLAKQVNGYYVLNDVFRYIAEEEDEETEEVPVPEPEAAALAPEPETQIRTLTSSDNLAEQEKNAVTVDNMLEKKADSPPAALSALANGTPEETDAAAEEPVTEPEASVEEPEEAPEVVSELPKDPEPTRVPTPKVDAAVPATPKEPAAPAKPTVPKTWASMLASNATAKAAPVPAPVATTATAPAQPKKAAVAAPAQVATASTPADDSQPLPSPGGWQTAGQEHTKKQNRQQSGSISGGAPEKGTVLGYIKNVTEKVDAGLLKSTLSKYGKLDYFDVSRPKNCAFVEFADVNGYNAAVAANPHSIGGEDILVEERRPRPNAYGGGFNPRGGMRGGRGGAGGIENRPPAQGGRGGYPKEGGRGGFTPRGRGSGTLTPRGRGVPQAA